MSKAKKPRPPNPLPCGCAVMGYMDIEMFGDDCQLRERFTDNHVVHCQIHGAAPKLLAACEAIAAAWDDDEIGQFDEAFIELARAAIAEARGTK